VQAVSFLVGLPKSRMLPFVCAYEGSLEGIPCEMKGSGISKEGGQILKQMLTEESAETRNAVFNLWKAFEDGIEKNVIYNIGFIVLRTPSKKEKRVSEDLKRRKKVKTKISGCLYYIWEVIRSFSQRNLKLRNIVDALMEIYITVFWALFFLPLSFFLEYKPTLSLPCCIGCIESQSWGSIFK